ncbi:MAG: DNA translocase FtsK [Anaerofustis stercorihominis]|nr:DNA translocase FtsK [Anaerofustis stercorihominis]
MNIESFTQHKAGMYVYIIFVNVLVLMSLSIGIFDNSPLSFGMIAEMWNTKTNGGFVGVFTAKVLCLLLSKTGAILFIIAVSIISFIMVFRKSISASLKNKASQIKEMSEHKITEKNLQKQKKLPPEDVAQNALELMEQEKKQLSKDISDFVNHNPVKKGVSENVITIESTPDKKTEEFFPPAKRQRNKKEQHEPATIEEIKKDNITDIGGYVPDEDDKNAEMIINEPAKVKTVDINTPSNEAELPGQYVFPSIDLLTKPENNTKRSVKEDSLKNAALLEKTLADFGIESKVIQVSMGPTVTRYELTIQAGTKVSKILNLADDLALAFASTGVRIEAPIPGKSAIGVEVPNPNPTTVHLSELLQSEDFINSKSPLAVALGKTITGEPLIADITKMPHLLIAGQTGSGKSVCINTIIMSILYHSSPDDVRMILIDPKMVELSMYNDIPQLLVPVVTDPKEAAGALNWAVSEMQQRYEKFAEHKTKNIAGYNKKAEESGEEKMYHTIIIIDELNDLMMSNKQSVEASICRLAQLARAAGIHLVVATQRPSVDVITGLIKANIPSRIAFSVTSQTDSRTILDASGADKLVGRGDMLFAPNNSKAMRAQCAYVSEEDVERVVEFIKQQSVAKYDDEVYEDIKSSAEQTITNSTGETTAFEDELLPKAMEVAFEKMIISTSTIQRRLRIGYARAGRIIDEMEDRGFISAADGSKPRNVLIGRDEFSRILNGNEEFTDIE